MSFIDDSSLRMLHEQSQLATSQLFKPSRLGSKGPQFPPAPTKAEQPVIPDPSIFDSLLSGNSPASIHSTPTIAECAVHLELLEALLVLKTKVLKSNSLDRAFGIATPAKRKEAFEKVRERKWKGYVALAVIRFETWWKNIKKILGSPCNEIASSSLVTEITTATLPPLDVLMVWHTLMLNPELYRRMCNAECPDVWKIRMPWTAIHSVIDADTRAYSLPTNASELFVSVTGFQPDLFAFLADFSNLPEHARKILTLAEDRGFSYAEYKTVQQSFSSSAQDGMLNAYLNRPEFALPRIKFDIKRYIENLKEKPQHTFKEAFPQLPASDEKTIGALIKATYTTLAQVNRIKDSESLRSSLTTTLSTSSFTRRNSLASTHMHLYTQPIHTLLSSYSPARPGPPLNPNHPAPGATEAAITRQALFITKMGALLWIRSPSLHGTLARGLTRYARFFSLLAAHPGKLLVPTLDIDLVWHTHQCSPAVYAAYARSATGRFVGHDDAVEGAVLKDAGGETGRVWDRTFGEEYERCLCWDCEALREVLEQGGEGDGDGDWERAAGRVVENVVYCRAVERARREGKMLPIRRLRSI